MSKETLTSTFTELRKGFLRLAMRFLPSQEDADDALQEAFFRLWKQADRISSREEAEDGTLRKLSSLKGTKINKVQLNFGGSANELWCEGGEVRFLLNMISESQKYQKNCGWFTSLVSKEKNLEKLYTKLKSVNVSEYKVIRMQQGTKSSRILAWRFATNS